MVSNAIARRAKQAPLTMRNLAEAVPEDHALQQVTRQQLVTSCNHSHDDHNTCHPP
jgi:hypothetical protein